MKTLLLAAASLPSINVLALWLVYVAVAVLLIWGIVQLVKWSGIPIPRPVWVVLTVLIGIFLIVWLARAFGIIV